MIVVAILVILAVLAVAVGVYFLSQATLGVGIIAIGCFLAIAARIAQAAKHQQELRTMQVAQEAKASAASKQMPLSA